MWRRKYASSMLRIRRHQRFLRKLERLLRPLRRCAGRLRSESFVGDQFLQRIDVRAIVEIAPRDQAAVPHRMQVAR